MARNLKDVENGFAQFRNALSSNDLRKCTDLLSKLKLKLTEFPSLPPLYQQTPHAKEELLLARNILEHAVLLSVRKEDEVAFERNFLQLKTYYTDTKHLLPPSAQEYPILGLNLLCLLVQNRIAEFHTELELLPPDVQSHPCLHHAINLEQSLMEGAYNRVLAARQQMPDPSFKFFMDLLVKTVRDEIAGCSEKAYEFLTLKDAKKLLMFTNEKDLLGYIKEHEWELIKDRVYFHNSSKVPTYKEIPSMQLISQTLGYARELERIV